MFLVSLLLTIKTTSSITRRAFYKISEIYSRRKLASWRNIANKKEKNCRNQEDNRRRGRQKPLISEETIRRALLQNKKIVDKQCDQVREQWVSLTSLSTLKHQAV